MMPSRFAFARRVLSRIWFVAFLFPLNAAFPRNRVDLQSPDPSVELLQEFKEARQSPERQRIKKTYREAREFMFGTLDNKGGEVESIYNGKKVKTRGIPDSNVMNTEHSWARSWFRSTLPRNQAELADVDLHHLFPSMSDINSLRGNLPFADLPDSVGPLPGGSQCDGSKFEPRDVDKGNIARAIFYFSQNYSVAIPNDQEPTLRKWHQADPVSPAEIERCNKIAGFQGNENPFVLHPELVGIIADF